MLDTRVQRGDVRQRVYPVQSRIKTHIDPRSKRTLHRVREYIQSRVGLRQRFYAQDCVLVLVREYIQSRVGLRQTTAAARIAFQMSESISSPE